MFIYICISLCLYKHACICMYMYTRVKVTELRSILDDKQIDLLNSIHKYIWNYFFNLYICVCRYIYMIFVCVYKYMNISI